MTIITFDIEANGPWVDTKHLNIRAVKNELNVVHLEMRDEIHSSAGAWDSMIWTDNNNVLPPGFRPAFGDKWSGCLIRHGDGTYSSGFLRITTGGHIRVSVPIGIVREENILAGGGDAGFYGASTDFLAQ